MAEELTAVAQSNNFNLKNELVTLVPETQTSRHVDMSLQQLESLRTTRQALPASKHGLEVICGASCETGAQ